MSKTIKSANVTLKPIEVSKALQQGEKFIKWDEDSGAGLPVTLRVDPKGFYLFWTDQNMEVEMLDIATIRDVRTGVHAKVPKIESMEDRIDNEWWGSELWVERVRSGESFSLVQDQKIRNVVLIGSQGSLEEKTVTVCYGADFVNVTFVNFCCTRRDIAQMWTEELFSLAYNLNQLNNPTIKFLEKLHTKIVLKADKSGKILVKNIVRQFAQNKEDKKRVEKALSESGLPTGKNDTISQSKFQFEDFFAFYKSLTQRTEVLKIFNNLFLMSEDNPIVAPSKMDLCDDMDQPLAHYFINSSHNTYLTGHQITGKSSVEIYRQSLLAGCRCVELDFWNGRTDEPIIVHGYTFVPEISAREVLEAIAESAFKTSDYPVILSFENHCNPRQQAKIANYCRDIFGDMLLDRPLDSHQLEPGGELPPPSLLKHKIIIKNKKKHHHHHKKEGSVGSEDVEARDSTQPQGNGEIAHGPLVRQGSKESSESSESESSSGEEEAEACGEGAGEGAGPGAPGAEPETHAAAEISALVNYVQPVHFSSFENAEKKNRFYEMSSFDEKQATTLLKERPIEFVNYNKHQLSRVYPAGTRFDSSNFMPQVFWNAGCQLVALNYQTLDLAMQLNLGTFEYNRRCGYLLKPEFMRRKDRRLDPFAESTVDGIIAGSLSVTVVSGQLLTDKRCGTYVEADMFGLPADTVRKKFRTRVAPNNGINPVYGDEPFVFKKVVLPELAMLRIAAHEESGRLLGHRVLPVLGLRPGYRHVNLRTELGLPLPASLLLLVVVKDYVPDRLSELAEALANPIKYQSELDKREHQLAVLTDDTDAPPAPNNAPNTAPNPGLPPHDDGRRLSSMASIHHYSLLALNQSKTRTRLHFEKNYIRNLKSDGADSSPNKAGMGGDSRRSLDADVALSAPVPTSVPAPLPVEDKFTREEKEKEEKLCWEAGLESTLAALLSSKRVRERRGELARKLDLLRRKRDPRETRPLSKLFRRGLSSKNISGDANSTSFSLASTGSVTSSGGGGGVGGLGAGTAEDGGVAGERELRLRYHHDIYAMLDKMLSAEQRHQMKELTVTLEAEKKEILNKLANSRKEDVKALAKKTNRDKDEILRIKREIHSQSVERGVAECSRLEQAYARRREQLALTHERLRAMLHKHRDQELLELEQLCGGAPDG
ncbi:1-phosphatidylinositol-4,5-bisphosphate phosphodiesterase classes I and II [Papilio xuthus]|uniref:1-phosphatidylinositol 4,5-bisphosphate phosphodiesterase n=1 Tax=Papilio xuthus TaxID=66420 RepID=A0A194PU19_PAPXU|nr:1-phosphatidylinositol-4,5-bisphosphate phosphodiesterase classes I and II [Papilio xuthus]